MPTTRFPHDEQVSASIPHILYYNFLSFSHTGYNYGYFPHGTPAGNTLFGGSSVRTIDPFLHLPTVPARKKRTVLIYA